ncbi:sodium-dependent neutral amino acid transporter B(0)AT3-like isoform X1 [Octopus sinensis]|uniref:Transporter n=1 Tax=Octopus sinensis TaxID=2607531 RepID=A0A6P7SSX3_9MOLL|nr:sodium-dependent neutral amino acid transporter B(0)AT3-like isoform X1 [Octopus sinensis]XP_036358015.1 sodium-dependent neutral amino acid transporter B(0)AT3-like isoform X1 [Octopus sinensis]
MAAEDSDKINLPENITIANEDITEIAETSFKEKSVKSKRKTPYYGKLVRGLLNRKRQRRLHRRQLIYKKFMNSDDFRSKMDNEKPDSNDTNSESFSMRRSASYSEALNDISFNVSEQSSSVFPNPNVSYELKISSEMRASAATLRQSTDELLPTDETRDSWDNKVQYLLAAIGLAVGLGNVWRFPYLAQKNGGGAFLLPYVIMLFVEGLPIFFLEVALGQRMRRGPVGTWDQISPYLTGIGYSCIMVSYIVCIYYNTIISWCLYYFALSFRSELLWAKCPNETAASKECNLAGPSAYFWYRSTLDVSSSIEESGSLQLHLELCLFFAWLIVFLCMIKGIQSSGKVIYFTATFPYVVLIIFFFRGVTLSNFYVGLKHLFIPKFEKLANPQVWLEAATQIFYSLSLGFGGLMAMSSYNPLRNNCYKDTFIVVFVNCGTSVFAGIVIFSILGFKAYKSFEDCQSRLMEVTKNMTKEAPFTCDLDKELENTAGGPGLAFIAFTEAINQFPVSPLWAILFFLMLLALGLDSMFGTLECITTLVTDSGKYPFLRQNRFFIPAVLCLTSFLISLSFAAQSGSYTFVLFDEFTGGLPLLFIAFAEVMSVSYIYGLSKFADDIHVMVGTRPSYFWLIMWKYISPLVMMIILLASLIKMIITGMTYEVWDKDTATKIKTKWPGWCLFIGSSFVILILIWIPLIFIIKRFNIINWKPDTKVSFPKEELRAEKNLQPYEMKDWEKKYLFIFEDL